MSHDHTDNAAIPIVIFSDICIYREGLTSAVRDIADPHGPLTAARLADAESLLDGVTEAVCIIDLASRDSNAFVRNTCAAGHPVAVLTLGRRPEELLRNVEAGAMGFLSRDDSADELRDCVRHLLRRERYFSPSVSGLFVACASLQHRRMRYRRNLQALTSRQAEIMSLLGEGMSNKAIARKTHLELSTVKNHVHNILQKLDVQTRGQAAALYRANSANGMSDRRN